jgi:CRP-like cAMP-binding protein
VLGCLDRGELRGLAQQATRMVYLEGEPVVVEGNHGIGFYVVLSGCASVSVDGELLRALRPGDCFGEVCLLGQERRSATVVAATDLECAVVAAWCFRALVAVHPCVADALAVQAELYEG